MWQEQTAPVFQNQLFLLKLMSVDSWLAEDDRAINQKWTYLPQFHSLAQLQFIHQEFSVKRK